MQKTVNALLLGDIIGQPGCRALFASLSRIIQEHHLDFVVANGENASDGFGLTPETADSLFSLGVDVITGGNHIWQKESILPYLEGNLPVLRPANYPKSAPGCGFASVQKKGFRFGVLNLIGRKNLVNVDCPIAVAKKTVAENRKNHDFILVDMHAEDSEEKEALAYALDGTVAAVVGTHTHVQTADERLLPNGTAYITDLGMTGPLYSVIGSEPDLSIERVTTLVPVKMVVADRRASVNGVIIALDPETKKALSIRRFSELV